MEIRLEVSGDADQGLVNLVWQIEGSQQRPYQVSKESLARASLDIRGILNQISAADDFQCEDPFEPFKAELCKAGSILFSNLFVAVDGDTRTADDVSEYLRQPPEAGTTLLVVTDGLVHVPWNFVTLPLHSPAQYTDLLFNYFNVRVTSQCSSILRQQNLPLQGNNFRVLFAIHRPFFDQALNSGYLSAKERELWQKMKALQIGTRTDWDSCEVAWDQIADFDSVISILGHSEEDEIHLYQIDSTNRGTAGKKYIMSYSRLMTFFRKRARTRSDSLLMLNVCSSAITKERYGPLAAAFGPGFNGLIGSEANILSVFALKYSLTFLGYLLAHQKNVGEAFNLTKQELFPRSLFYTCCANPRFAVQPIFA